MILTARARKPLFGPAEGELVLLEMPRVNYPLAEQNLPWRETVLAKGPDVMFEVWCSSRKPLTLLRHGDVVRVTVL